MLLLFSNPRVGLSLALETGVTAGKGADLIDVDGKRAVRFRDGPIISHASKYGHAIGCRQTGSSRSGSLYNELTPIPKRRLLNFLDQEEDAVIRASFGRKIPDKLDL